MRAVHERAGHQHHPATAIGACPLEARLDEPAADATTLDLGVDRQHPDPGLAVLLELRVRRPGARHVGHSAEHLPVLVDGDQHGTDAGAAGDVADVLEVVVIVGLATAR